MYCGECGKEIDEEEKYCPYCGKQILDSFEQNNNGKYKNKKLVMVAIILVVIVVISSVLIYLASADRKLKKGNESFNTGDYDTAQMFYNEALKKNNKCTDAYVALFDMYLECEQYDEAIKVYDLARKNKALKFPLTKMYYLETTTVAPGTENEESYEKLILKNSKEKTCCIKYANTIWKYDDSGNIKEIEIHHNGVLIGFLNFIYDERGNNIKREHFDKERQLLDYEEIEYNAENKLISHRYYDSHGNQGDYFTYNSKELLLEFNNEYYGHWKLEYDENGCLNLSTQLDENGNIIEFYRYENDIDYNIKRVEFDVYNSANKYAGHGYYDLTNKGKNFNASYTSSTGIVPSFIPIFNNVKRDERILDSLHDENIYDLKQKNECIDKMNVAFFCDSDEEYRYCCFYICSDINKHLYHKNNPFEPLTIIDVNME